MFRRKLLLHPLMMTPRLTILIIVVISLLGAGGLLAAFAQETVVDDNNNDDAPQKTDSLPLNSNYEQNSPIDQITALNSTDDAVDVISRQLAVLRTVAPGVDIENSTATEIGDLLEFYGLDTDGPVCPPCP
jgi:hypothetical protein